MPLKKLFLLFFISSIYSATLLAQSGEIGIGIGTFNYRGEISPNYDPTFQKFGAMAFYRHNFSPVFSIRGSAAYGFVGATNERDSDPLSQFRPITFRARILEFAVMPEYNFFNFRGKNNIPKATFYFTGGLALLNYNTNAPLIEGASGSLHPVIPLGCGMKAMIGGLTNLGLEFGARKTFDDYIDGVSDTFGNGVQRGFRYDTDWYYYAGISISYIFYQIPCPYFSY